MDVEPVQENGPEEVGEKQIIFAEPDKLAPLDALLVSSTFGYRALLLKGVSVLETPLGRARCLVGHPANPPHLRRWSSCAVRQRTAPEAIDRARNAIARSGKCGSLSTARSTALC